MRALLIGLGGAGCQIVDTLNQHDERSGVQSVRSFVFDADQKTIAEMQSIPQEDRFVLTPTDPIKENNTRGTDFEVGNLASCFQRDGVHDVDAVFVCAGLGGRMAELVPTVVEQLNDAFADPVFCILTLPGRNEGVKVSARASETLAEIRKVSQATILFDNETWFKRIEEEDNIKNQMEAKRKATIYEMYPVLNEMLARRVGLLLRAGEFNHRGVEAAEVVLDAGEVLNTLKNMDLVAIGYATEKLPTTWTNSMMKRVRVEKYLLEENQARTSRIVELAKQAVYREVSVPCDLTSSEKALVLIAGPSDELSMKGFQTVRKWIDRSIKGLEMRAGDYPVKSTQYVGVIIVLAGLENVPRVKELDEIRDIYEEEQSKEYEGEEEETKPAIQIAGDAVLFEEEMVMPIGLGMPSAAPVYENEEDMFELEDDYSGNMLQEAGQPLAYESDDVFEDEEAMNRIESEDVFEDEEYYSEDVFEDEVHQQYGYQPGGNDDVFEDVVRRVVAPPPPQQQYIYPPQYVQQYIQPPQQQATIFDESMTQERSVLPAAKPREMPKITIAGPKKQPQMSGSTIMMPKRERKEDTVLAGMADVGGRDKPKDSDKFGTGMASVGGTGRPKETMSAGVLEGSVTVGHQRPKETDGHVRMSGGQRPKETDGHIRMSGGQRPKETDGHIRMSGSQRPKEMDGPVRMSGSQRPKEMDGPVRMAGAQEPKEIDGTIRSGPMNRPKEIGDSTKVRDAQKPREVNKGIRVTSIPLPKNAAVKQVAKKSDKDKWV
ncbi:tubulin/FtsZ family protein [Methanorbis rubei]|uniref:Tubulin-like protein CetZ n=1 Tax=Methanorbis rubei TaxID=3028300 RepID=A0AAE4SDZ4_9EURY|nr:Tubulin-like protein CetZ [Methanocorpusculaceae archaeon Cs1]